MTNPEESIHRTPPSVTSRLAELGLNKDILRSAAEWGLQQASQTTRHDPPNLFGILLWAKIVRHLRDRLVPQDWHPDNRQNFATVVNSDNTMAIAVAAGDRNTGVRNETPSTRSARGPMTEDAIQSNQMHFHDLFSDFPGDPPPPQTWLLLHNFDEKGEQIRLELSLPSVIDADGFVVEWRERVILDAVPFTSSIDSSSEADHSDDDDDLEQDIIVTRR